MIAKNRFSYICYISLLAKLGESNRIPLTMAVQLIKPTSFNHIINANAMICFLKSANWVIFKQPNHADFEIVHALVFQLRLIN